MIRLFIGLKARLLRNTLRGSGGYGLVVFSFVAMTAGVTAAVLVWRAESSELLDVGPAMGGLMVLSWALAPLLFGASDETIDTTRLAMFPLPERQLATGLAGAGLIGPGPVAASLPLFAFALRSPSVPSALLALVAATVTILLATTASRWLLTALGARLRRRRSRDLATVLAGLGAGMFGLSLQLVGRLGPDLGAGQIASVGRVLRYTPFGWSGDALGRAANGELVLPVVELMLTAALIAVVLRMWVRTLVVALADADDGASAAQLHGDLLPRVGLFASKSPVLAAVVAKERRYLFRHPRYRVQIVSQGTVLLVGGAPFLSAVVARDPAAVLMGCIPGLTAGVTGSNLLGSDGRALWGEAVALPSLRPVLRGRSLAFVIIGLGAATLLTLGVATWTGGWQFAPVALSAAIGMAFAGAGVGGYTSTVAPTLFPDDNAPNPFASSAPGGGCLSGIATIIGVVIGLLAAAPILLGLALTQGSFVAGVITTVLAPIYGFLLWLFITNQAARRADKKMPEMVQALSSG